MGSILDINNNDLGIVFELIFIMNDDILKS